MRTFAWRRWDAGGQVAGFGPSLSRCLVSFTLRSGCPWWSAAVSKKNLLHVGPDVIPTFVQKNPNKQKNPLSLVLFCAWAVGGAVLRIGYGTDRWRRSV